MDQTTAKMLLREGGTLLFFDMPEGSEFGMDYNSWTVGPRFRGVKMIPPGIHYIYYSSKSSFGETGPRTGFFYDFKHREMVIRKWDKYTEDVKSEVISEEERERYISNMEELDRYLAPYPYDTYKKWVSMTTHLTSDLLTQLQPACGKITSVAQFQSVASDSKMRLEAQQKKEEEAKASGDADKSSEEPKLPHLDTIPGTEIRFSEIPKQRYPDGATPLEITKHSMDSTYILDTLLGKYHSTNSTSVLGEIQFSFICFLIGQVYDAFDQWKRLVHLMCSSETALNTHKDLFMNFISMIHFEIQDIPEDFFVDIVSTDNFLTATLQEFFSNLEQGNGAEELRQRGLKFRDHLTKKFNWDFTSEPDDYAPVIVETSNK